jgi:Cys-tRNA(Pro)/Cys-tRNA(Cys) deacylase
MAKKADRSAGTPATALLTTAKVDFTLHPYDVSPDAPNYGALVAEALGVPPDSVFKTLVADVDGALTVAVVPVTGDLDLKALAAAAGGKRAALADRAAAERSSGYVRGGISPLGQRRTLPTVIEASALDLDRMYVSAGRRGLQASLAPADLVRLTHAVTAKIRT